MIFGVPGGKRDDCKGSQFEIEIQDFDERNSGRVLVTSRYQSAERKKDVHDGVDHNGDETTQEQWETWCTTSDLANEVRSLPDRKRIRGSP